MEIFEGVGERECHDDCRHFRSEIGKVKEKLGYGKRKLHAPSARMHTKRKKGGAVGAAPPLPTVRVAIICEYQMPHTRNAAAAGRWEDEGHVIASVGASLQADTNTPAATGFCTKRKRAKAMPVTACIPAVCFSRGPVRKHALLRSAEASKT